MRVLVGCLQLHASRYTRWLFAVFLSASARDRWMQAGSPVNINNVKYMSLVEARPRWAGALLLKHSWTFHFILPLTRLHSEHTYLLSYWPSYIETHTHTHTHWPFQYDPSYNVLSFACPVTSPVSTFQPLTHTRTHTNLKYTVCIKHTCLKIGRASCRERV